MAGDNRMELVVEVNADQANSGLKALNQNISVFERQALSTSRSATGGFDAMTAGMARSNTSLREGREAAMLMGEEVGVRLPRAVSRFLAQTDLVGPALATAFEASVFVAMGAGLVKLIEKFPTLLNSIEDFTLGLGESRAELVKDSAEMVKFGEHARDLRNELSLIGLTGIPKLSKESELAAGSLSDAQRQATILKNTYDSLTKARQEQEAKVQWQRKHAIAGGMEIGPGIQMGLNALFGVSQKQVDDAWKAFQTAQDKVRQLTVTTAQAKSKVTEESNKEEIDAAKQLRKENLANYDEIIAAHMDASRRDFEATKKDNDAQEVLLKKTHDDAIASWNEVVAAHVAAANRDVELIKKESDAVASLQNSNVTLQESILRGKKDYAGATQLEIAALDNEKTKYAGNADAIAAIEERKKLLIEQSNMEIAKDAQSQFERSAAAIEGFFDRVFAHAKSFADIWKSLWSQAVGYVEHQFAHLAASMIIGRNAGTPTGAGGAPGGGGFGGGGILATMGGIAPILRRRGRRRRRWFRNSGI